MRDHTSIRQGFLDYFAGHGHAVVPSHSLIPPADPTLLFVNAGMVQFKDLFVGLRKAPYVRAASSQRCLRVSGKHNDLENVGRTPRHHTFFEMLGNFSFGDYFKRDAVRFGWEFLTEVAGLDKARLWVTIHPDDDEAFRHWRHDMGVPADRIVRDPANVWSMGDTGPNGPCSEIHWDRGEAWDPGVTFGAGYEGDRYLEVWNLVFMQYDRAPDGTVTPLPKPSIDTGMGLERLAAILQGVDTNYDTDLFLPLIGIAAEAAGRPYRKDADDDVALRVIADHARATAFLIADGIYPENEGRGYVLRRVMRRAIRFGRKLGLEHEFFTGVCGGVVDLMAASYPELVERRKVIERYVRAEEERFGRTLSEGLEMLDRAIARSRDRGQVQLDGDLVFKLYDTHGFPVDLTRLIAEEQGVGVDEAGFETAMAAQRERGRASWKERAADSGWLEDAAERGMCTAFVGFGSDQVDARVVAIYQGDQRVERSEGPGPFVVLTDRTPFYGESGGQVGDRGSLTWQGGGAQVLDTSRPTGDLIAHHVHVDQGYLVEGGLVHLAVDPARRAPTRRHHTATHLLQNGLRAVLGDHVKQRGSLVGPDRLRFDFSHHGPLTADEITRVEAHVNQMVRADYPVVTAEKPMEQALKEGAIAFFEEKYAEVVRVVNVGGQSVELCGGTHVARTGEIGAFVILSEAGISSGVRRVEALAGADAITWMQEQRAVLADLKRVLPGTPVEGLAEKVDVLQRAVRDAEAQVAGMRTRLAGASLEEEIARARPFGDAVALVKTTEGLAMNDLVALSDRIREHLTKAVVLLINHGEGGAVNLVVAVRDLPAVQAGKVLGEVAGAAGGKGGGRPDLARGGAPDASRIDLAIEAFYRIVERTIAASTGE